MKKWMVLAVMLGVMTSAIYGAPSEKKEPKHNDRLAEADRLFNLGLKHRDRAWEYEKKAAAIKVEKDSDVYAASAQREYKLAIEAFREASEQNSRHHEAFGSLGYALRKTGQYDASLKAYDRALKMKPDYAEALEYRAEAYLKLNRVDDARSDYQKLVGLDRDQARVFLMAASEWLEAGGDGSNGFKAWVDGEKQKVGPGKGQAW